MAITILQPHAPILWGAVAHAVHPDIELIAADEVPLVMPGRAIVIPHGLTKDLWAIAWQRISGCPDEVILGRLHGLNVTKAAARRLLAICVTRVIF